MSSIIKSGSIVDILMFLVSVLFISFAIWRATKQLPEIRNIPALDAIEEMVGRATEMNRPVHFTTGAHTAGAGGMFRSTGPAYLAGISVLSRVAEVCAKYNCMVYVTSINTESVPLLEEVIGDAYRSQGKPDLFNPAEQLLVITTHQASFVAFMLDLVTTKQVAGNIAAGMATFSAFMIYEAGSRVGAFQIGALAGIGGGQAMAAAVCDYLMIGTEIYGASAIINQKPDELGSLIGEDMLKMLALGLLVLGFLLKQVGNTLIPSLLSK